MEFVVPALRHDFVVAYNENHDIHLKFKNDNCDGTSSEFTSNGYVCHFVIKENNSDSEGIELLSLEQPITGDTCTFSLAPAEVSGMGEGEKWFDMWLTNETNGDYHKPVVYGTYTIKILTTRGL